MSPTSPPHDLSILAELERKVLWLATWTIHYANHVPLGIGSLKGDPSHE